MNPHDIPPQVTNDPPPEAAAALHRIESSDYFSMIAPLQPLVVGRRVADVIPGHSGFILYLDEDYYFVVVYLHNGQLKWAGGPGVDGPEIEHIQLISSPEYGDGRQPLASGFYAEGICDIPAALLRAKGEVIEGISFGETTFNFRFPGGRELETIIGPTHDGRLALRVFWEQW